MSKIAERTGAPEKGEQGLKVVFVNPPALPLEHLLTGHADEDSVNLPLGAAG